MFPLHIIAASSARSSVQPGTDPHFSKVQLLLHMTGVNGETSFVDKSPTPKTMVTMGNAQVDTSVSKFGGGSMKLDGSGDYLKTADSNAWSMGNQPFTVEFWIRFNTLTGSQRITGQCETNGSTASISFQIQKGSTNKIAINGGGTLPTIIGTTTVTTGVWYHIAATGDGSTLRLFLNGVLEGSAAYTTMFDSAYELAIGRLGQYNGDYVNGWINDYRITKGVARYTANFTPPTEAFPDA